MGKGYLAGSQKGLAFLPERHTDFIFSVVGEELGLIGAIVVLGLFALLVFRALRIAVQVKRPFGSALAVGVATYFAFQALVNIGITVGLLPVTGLPLPFLTYGGSSMLASCVMVGLLLNVSADGLSWRRGDVTAADVRRVCGSIGGGGWPSNVPPSSPRRSRRCRAAWASKSVGPRHNPR